MHTRDSASALPYTHTNESCERINNHHIYSPNVINYVINFIWRKKENTYYETVPLPPLVVPFVLVS